MRRDTQGEAVGRSMSRRSLLHWAGRAGVGLSLSGLLRAQAAVAESAVTTPMQPRIRSCIVIFYYGGPSHLETFDLKPEAPSEVRGEFQPISTSVPGITISEHLPLTAQVMHHVAVIRSMHHENRLHDSASTETLTGRQSPQGDREEFAPIAQFYPCHGATLSYLWRQRNLDVSHAALPWLFHNVVDVPCQGGGFLGAAYDPLLIRGNSQSLDYNSELFTQPAGLNLGRLAQRRQLLDQMETPSKLDTLPQSTQLRTFYHKALELMKSSVVREALDIGREPASVRERYGLPADLPLAAVAGDMGIRQNLRGQNFLLARRLVEAGVPFVNVYDFKQQGQNWDAHADNFKQHRDQLLPPVDKGYSALIEDLHQRGLLDSTLVVALGEFGRTPKINQNAGRDHWPDCYSITLAGGGVRGGTIYGASDRLGAYPSQAPVTPADLAATIYWRFGLSPAAEIHDPTGRPHRLADGRPLESLFG